MAGNTFGAHVRVTTFGESHGRAMGAVIDGVRPGLAIDAAQIQKELDRRRPGQSRVTTPRQEADRVEILSGILDGKTTGTPICLLIWNTDQRPEAYEAIKHVFRPGHAGYTYLAKYGVSDYRGGGRSSGRETASRVAAGAVARAVLKEEGIRITGYTREAAGVAMETFDPAEIERNPMRCPDPGAAREMERRVMEAKEEGDSVGGVVEVVVTGVPPGLGEPVFDKLEADLAKALLSIGAIRGFEVGNGFASARLRGSENNDVMYKDPVTGRIRTRTNHAGGIAGGISNGEDIVVRIAVKPPSSIRKEQETVTADGESTRISVQGRHDPCLCPRIVPVAESMVALTLLDHLMRQRILAHPREINRLRSAVDLVDRDILLLLAERQALVRQIGEAKRARGRTIADPGRESKILKRQSSLARRLGLDQKFVERLMRTLFRASRSAQARDRRRDRR